MTKKVLITGATGNIGTLLTKKLAGEDSVDLRVLVRDADKASHLKDLGAELAIGSFDDAASIKSAVEGVDTIALISPAGGTAAELVSTVLKAAKAAGVRKIVRLSAIKASTEGPTLNSIQHGITDAEILETGITYTIFRPHYFMQNMLWSGESLTGESKFYQGMGDGAMGMVDVRDIADSAAAAVLSDQFDNQIFELTGPESITFHDVAATLTDVLGRSIEYVPVSPEAVEQSILDLSNDQWFATVMRQYSQAYSENWGDFTTDNVEKLTGHPARSFKSFAREVLAPALG